VKSSNRILVLMRGENPWESVSVCVCVTTCTLALELKSLCYLGDPRILLGSRIDQNLSSERHLRGWETKLCQRWSAILARYIFTYLRARNDTSNTAKRHVTRGSQWGGAGANGGGYRHLVCTETCRSLEKEWLQAQLGSHPRWPCLRVVGW
jgi:hypothetical protein